MCSAFIKNDSPPVLPLVTSGFYRYPQKNKCPCQHLKPSLYIPDQSGSNLSSIYYFINLKVKLENLQEI